MTAASTSSGVVPTGGESTGSRRTFQTSRIGRIEDEQPQPIFGLLHRVSAMISCSWFAATSACADSEIERRRLSDVHLGLVHARQLLGELERAAAAHRRWRAPTPGSSRPPSPPRSSGRRSRAAACPRRRGWSGSCARLRAGTRRSRGRGERLRHVQRQPRLQQRVVAVQEAVAVGVRRVPAEAVRRAEPGQPLAERRRST